MCLNHFNLVGQNQSHGIQLEYFMTDTVVIMTRKNVCQYNNSVNHLKRNFFVTFLYGLSSCITQIYSLTNLIIFIDSTCMMTLCIVRVIQYRLSSSSDLLESKTLLVAMLAILNTYLALYPH